MTDHAWVRDVPTAVLEELAEWWSEGFVIVTREDAGDAHLPSCDGSAHTPEDWTAAVCAELARRRAQSGWGCAVIGCDALAVVAPSGAHEGRCAKHRRRVQRRRRA